MSAPAAKRRAWAIIQAIEDGLRHAEQMGMTKPNDQAHFVRTALDSAGFKIVSKRLSDSPKWTR